MNPTSPPRPRTVAQRRRRVVLGVVIGALAVSILPLSTAAPGAWAKFTAQNAGKVSGSTGSVVLVWNTARSDHFTAAIAGLKPNESAQSIADVTNTGSLPLSVAALSFAGTDVGSTSDGVHVAIDRCSVDWDTVLTLSTCPGTITSLTASRPSTGVVVLTGSPVYSPGGIDHLRFTFRLPASSPGIDRGKTGSVDFTASGIAVAPGQR